MAKATTKKTTTKRKTSPARKTPVKKKESPNLFVRDILATEGSRTHELVDSKGATHLFTFDSPRHNVEVPSDIVTASGLLNSEGFHVAKEKDGPALRPQVQKDEVAYLGADECIASLTELTDRALLVRCKNSGADFTPHTARGTMITYLMGVTDGNESLNETLEADVADDDLEEEEEDSQPADNEFLMREDENAEDYTKRLMEMQGLAAQSASGQPNAA